MSVAARVVIDESILDGYRALQDEGQPDVVTEFIDLFLEDLPGRLDTIRLSVNAGDPPTIKSAAHALKGASASVGAVALSGLCAQLEANARTGSSHGALELLSAIEVEAIRAREELSKLRRP